MRSFGYLNYLLFYFLLVSCATMPAASVDRSPYHPPKSAVRAFFWRRRVLFESTFAFTMLEPWEKILLRMSSAVPVLLAAKMDSLQ